MATDKIKKVSSSHLDKTTHQVMDVQKATIKATGAMGVRNPKAETDAKTIRQNNISGPGNAFNNK